MSESVHSVPGGQLPGPIPKQNGNEKHWCPTHCHDDGQSALDMHSTSAMHDAVPRLQTVPGAQSVFPRHGSRVQAPATQRSPIAQPASVVHVEPPIQLPSTQRPPPGQSESRAHEPTNTQPPPMQACRAGHSASLPHVPVNTQRPSSHA